MMSDFAYDCLQRKRLAQQAKHRKCGSKSKKCSLSTDHMTQRQWKQRNGEIVMINLNQPMDWGAFKGLPKHLQEEYLANLQERFHINCSSLSEMFNVHKQTIRNYCKSTGLGIDFPSGHRMNAEQLLTWQRFLNRESAEEQETASRSQEPDDEDTTEADKACVESESDTSFKGKQGVSQTTMTSFTLCFQGKLDVNMISNSLLRIIGNESSGEIKIVCKLQ